MFIRFRVSRGYRGLGLRGLGLPGSSGLWLIPGPGFLPALIGHDPGHTLLQLKIDIRLMI